MDKISLEQVGFAAAVGGITGLIGAPIVVYAVGFKAGGIAAGSLAAKMMSSAAIGSGGGIVAGSTVSVLQSVGVLGFSVKTTAVIAGVAGSGTALVTGVTKDRNKEEIVMESTGGYSKSIMDGASYITSNATSVLQSAGNLGSYIKPSVLTTGVAGGYRALVTGVTGNREETTADEAKGKGIMDGCKSVIGGASDVMASTSSLLSECVKKSSSLWPGAAATGSDVKKEN